MPVADRRAATAPQPPGPADAAGLRWLGLPALWRSLCGIGLVLGALCLAASLTPSLIPRSFMLQGVLAGVSFAVGYAFGVIIVRLWDYLGLPFPSDRTNRLVTWISIAVSATIVLAFVWRASFWQNSIRERMGMPLVEDAHSLEVAAIAIVTFLVLLFVGRLFWWIFGLVQRRVERYVPPRVARLVGIVAAVTVFFLVIDGVLVRAFLRLSDQTFRTLDALIEPDVAPPSDPLGTGSTASLVDWQDLGRAGREFVSTGPTQAEIEAVTGRPALRPIRVYAGLNSAATNAERAQLALDELIRVGGFERKVLVVTVPTGTGWMDPAATNTLEYLHGGDTAIVAMQYSYLTSWISLLAEPGYSTTSGREIFRTIYRYWSQLPEATRPQLYLYGLSLGAYGSEQSFGLHEILADPFQGAVWAGPPFSTPQWRQATRYRNPGTPEWLPEYGDGSVIRFTNQENHLDIPGATWGPLRIVYLQYASDPITFFDPAAFWRKPDWMNPPVGPDVSPELRWYPAVTFLQLLLDMATGLLVPIGHGHFYAPQHYIDAWVAVTAPEGWSVAEIDRLKARLAE